MLQGNKCAASVLESLMDRDFLFISMFLFAILKGSFEFNGRSKAGKQPIEVNRFRIFFSVVVFMSKIWHFMTGFCTGLRICASVNEKGTGTIVYTLT